MEAARVLVQESLEGKVVKLLGSLNIPRQMKGYVYLREAILMTVDDFSYAHSITKGLYPDIAKKYGDAPNRVERAIRHVLDIIWKPENIEKINKATGAAYTADSKRPTNGEFIALIADSLSYIEN